MSNLLLILTALLPLAYGQLYFPDEKTGGFIAVGAPEIPIGQGVAASVPANLSELRGTEIYEQYVEKVVSEGILKLTLATKKAIASKEQLDNVVFAPVSIGGCLALVLLGSNGKTFSEISQLMGLATGFDIHNKSQIVHQQFGRIIQKLQTKSGFDLKHNVKFASGIFLQQGYPIRRLYKTAAETIYKSEVLPVDFAQNAGDAKNKINSWVSQRTGDKIPKLLEDNPSAGTKVILVSAMYFKAEWEKQFLPYGSTQRTPFYTNGRNAKHHVMVDMMANEGYFPYFKDRTLDCEILGLPYKGNHTTMYVVIPKNSDKNKLGELEAKLTSREIYRLVDSVKYTESLVFFPKMHIDSTIDLKRSLQALGVQSLFNPLEANLALLSPGFSKNEATAPVAEAATSTQSTSDDVFVFNRNAVANNTLGEKIQSRIAVNLTETLDGIRHSINQHPNPELFENPGLYVDQVIHKVYMDITETGTEAAAATAVNVYRTGNRLDFIADVPFFFFIMHEETKMVLFWGSVITPMPNYK